MQQYPDGMAPGVTKSFFTLTGRPSAVEQRRGLRRIDVRVERIGEVAKRPGADLFGRISRDPAQRVVHAQRLTGHVDHGHADWRVRERIFKRVRHMYDTWCNPRTRVAVPRASLFAEKTHPAPALAGKRRGGFEKRRPRGRQAGGGGAGSARRPPAPRGFDDRLERDMHGHPRQHATDTVSARDEYGWIARPPRPELHWNPCAGHTARDVQHFANGVAGARSEIERIMSDHAALERLECRHMRAREIRDMNVVTHAG